MGRSFRHLKIVGHGSSYPPEILYNRTTITDPFQGSLTSPREHDIWIGDCIGIKNKFWRIYYPFSVIPLGVRRWPTPGSARLCCYGNEDAVVCERELWPWERKNWREPIQQVSISPVYGDWWKIPRYFRPGISLQRHPSGYYQYTRNRGSDSYLVNILTAILSVRADLLLSLGTRERFT